MKTIKLWSQESTGTDKAFRSNCCIIGRRTMTRPNQFWKSPRCKWVWVKSWTNSSLKLFKKMRLKKMKWPTLSTTMISYRPYSIVWSQITRSSLETRSQTHRKASLRDLFGGQLDKIMSPNHKRDNQKLNLHWSNPSKKLSWKKIKKSKQWAKNVKFFQ